MPESETNRDAVPVRPVLGAWRPAPGPEPEPEPVDIPPSPPEPEAEPEPTREEISRASAAPPRRPGDVPGFVSGPDGRGRRRGRARKNKDRGGSRATSVRGESRRRAERRRKMARLLLASACLLGLAAFFGAGFAWKTRPLWRAQKKIAIPSASRPEAIALVNEAVAARKEGRFDDAAAAASQAIALDPSVPGADIVLAEVAFARSDSEGVRRAARRAIEHGARVADAKLLLALDAWMSRGREKKLGDVEVISSQLMGEAAEAEPANSSVYFFRGELLRTVGRSDDARRAMLGSMHRLLPWSSADIIGAKLCLAAADAGQPEPSPAGAGRALLELRQDLRENRDPQAALDLLEASATSWQRRVLLADPAFADFAGPRVFVEARSESVAPVPHGQIPPPAADSARP